MSDNPTLEQPTKKHTRISQRKLKAKALVNAVLEPNATYREVGEKFYPKANFPAQTVYNCLQQPSAQAELNKICKSLDDKRAEHERLAMELHNQAKDSGQLNAATNALQLTAKIAGTMVERVEVSQKDTPESIAKQAQEAIQSLLDANNGRTIHNSEL